MATKAVLPRRPKGVLPTEPNALVGSAVRLAGPGMMPRRWSEAAYQAEWQEIAWGYYDRVGELRFAANWLGQALARANLYAARIEGPGQEPAPLDAGPAVEVVEALGGGPGGQAEILRRLGVQLTVSGVSYLLGEPPPDEPGADLRDASWEVVAGQELTKSGRGLSLQLPEGNRRLHPDTLVARIWRAHPRRFWEPDSPVRAVLPVLAELEMLTQHILAAATSRLAGNGILLLPMELSFPVAGPGDDPEQAATDPFLTELTETMVAAIADRSSAAAVVPIVLRAPGEWLDKIKHLKFESAFDENSKELRDEAVRRFAAGMDLPAEVVLGLGDTNHWSAWQLAESAITIHVAPLMLLICNALTEHFLWPTLEAMGENPEGQVVWFDLAGLTAKPNLAQDAKDLFTLNAIGLDALRRAVGFADDDAPSEEELQRQIILSIVKGAPSLAPCLLPALGIDIPEGCVPEATGTQVAEIAPTAEEVSGVEVIPERPSAPPELAPPAQVASAVPDALVAAAEGVVFRALERAGSRLRSLDPEIRKRVNGTHSAGICCEAGPIPDGERLDQLLAGAWDRLPELAERHQANPALVTGAVSGLVRGLLASGAKYDPEQVRTVLGAVSL